jgi:hypothetical protein
MQCISSSDAGNGRRSEGKGHSTRSGVLQAFIVVVHVAHDEDVSLAGERHAVLVIHIGFKDSRIPLDGVTA